MTYTDEFAERDERGLELERRIERYARFGSDEWRRRAVELYQQLKDIDKHERKHKRAMLQHEIDTAEAELSRLKEEMEGIDEGCKT